MNNFFTRINDGLNPILVKETRQTLSKIGYYVIGALILLLIMTLGGISTKISGDIALNIVKMADIIIVAFITLVHAARINQERRGNTELMFNTPMSPFKIVLGKYLSILCFSVFTIALSLPFATACYFMNGVSLIDVVYVVAQIIVCSLIFASTALFVCSMPREKITDSLPVIAVGAYALVLTVALTVFISVASSSMHGGITVNTLLMSAVYIATGFTLTMVNLTAPSDNRFIPAKIIVFISLAVISFIKNDIDVTPFIVLFCVSVMGGITIASPVNFSHRILEGRPRILFARVIAFLFVNNIYPAAILTLAAMTWSTVLLEDNQFLYTFFFPVIYITLALHIKAFAAKRGRMVNGGFILIGIGIADILIRLMLIIFDSGSIVERAFNWPDEVLSGTCVVIIYAVAALTLLSGVVAKAKKYCFNNK